MLDEVVQMTDVLSGATLDHPVRSIKNYGFRGLRGKLRSSTAGDTMSVTGRDRTGLLPSHELALLVASISSFFAF